MKDINTLTVADLTEDAPPFTGWRWATEEAISAWGQAMKHGDKDVLDLAGKVKRQLDMMVVAPRAGKPVDFQAAYEYLNEKGVHYIGPSHLVEFALLLDYKERFAKPAQDSTWGSSTLADLDAALDGAHELSGAPHERISELIRQRDDAKTRLLKMENDFNALTRLCKRAETAAAEAQVELKNLRTAKPLGKIPPEGDAEHWKNLYLQEMACRITWQQKALENMAELSRSFEQWWEDKRDELIQDTDPRRHAESTWNASAANWARTEYVPVATLHDDGYFTWHGEKPPGFNYAGWRMKVYVDPAELEK